LTRERTPDRSTFAGVPMVIMPLPTYPCARRLADSRPGFIVAGVRT
jgi:hypothetical protein